jgi:hypothetical protein
MLAGIGRRERRRTMGWGCYKHEWDEGSADWEAHAEKLCNERLKTHDDWGRDGAICPKCYLEERAETKTLIEKLANALGFYADKDNYITGHHEDLCEVSNDWGQIARDVLKEMG